MESKYLQQFKKGSLDMILLCLISRGETYGYELVTALNNESAPVLGYAREGTVYPILYRLQEQGLIDCRMEKAPLILCVATAVMIFKHVENIQRMLNKTEIGLRSTIKGENRVQS